METSRIPDARLGLRRMFIRDLVLEASVGVFPHEHQALQRIRINVDLGVVDEGARTAGAGGAPALSRGAVGPDQLSRVVDYGAIAGGIRAIVASGHVRLVETLAERIAERCLRDARVEVARVMVEKLDIMDDATSVGVEIERRRR